MQYVKAVMITEVGGKSTLHFSDHIWRSKLFCSQAL